jgi:capsular exopolysaccharide synthesis family protein
MSQIFDALQRAQSERNGNDPQTPLNATEVLARAERLVTSEWEKADSTVEVSHPDRAHDDSNVQLRSAVAHLTGTTLGSSYHLTAKQGTALLDSLDMVELRQPVESRLVTLTQPESPTAEAFRLLGVRLRDLRRERTLKKVLVTSTIPQEGKSTVAANLACTLSQTGKERILLIEGDVRKPVQARIFGFPAHPGLCDWLQGDRDLAKCMFRLKDSDLWIMPAGSSTNNPINLLQLNNVTSLMNQLEGMFDMIVIDSPPILPMADTSVWTRLTDGILLVARAGKTEKRQLVRGLEAIEKEKLIGALLNCSKSTANAYYYY